jgi:hypothetical protein
MLLLIPMQGYLPSLLSFHHHPDVMELLLVQDPSVPSLQIKILIEREDLLLCGVVRFKGKLISTKREVGSVDTQKWNQSYSSYP